MLGWIKTILIILLVGALVFLVIKLPELTKKEPVQKEVPCEELRWMRDSPQAKCVEFWNNYKVEEV